MMRHHFQLFYSVRPLDLSQSAAEMAASVGSRILTMSVEGWDSPVPLAQSITGVIKLSDRDVASDRDEAQARIKSVFSDVLLELGASFDVSVRVEAMVERLGPTFTFDV